jgi:hypothetical protein
VTRKERTVLWNVVVSCEAVLADDVDPPVSPETAEALRELVARCRERLAEGGAGGEPEAEKRAGLSRRPSSRRPRAGVYRRRR